MEKLREAFEWYEWAWQQRDRRADSFVMMQSVIPTLALCLGYVYTVKVWGPNYMRDRPPYQIKSFILVYNAFQVVLNSWLCQGVSRKTYSFVAAQRLARFKLKQGCFTVCQILVWRKIQLVLSTS